MYCTPLLPATGSRLVTVPPPLMTSMSAKVKLVLLSLRMKVSVAL